MKSELLVQIDLVSKGAIFFKDDQRLIAIFAADILIAVNATEGRL